jgi:rubredoxin
MGRFDEDEGRQPCKDFKEMPDDPHLHQCPHCGASRRFCSNCHQDHHERGWAVCWELTALRKLVAAFDLWRTKDCRLKEVEDAYDELDDLRKDNAKAS